MTNGSTNTLLTVMLTALSWLGNLVQATNQVVHVLLPFAQLCAAVAAISMAWHQIKKLRDTKKP